MPMSDEGLPIGLRRSSISEGEFRELVLEDRRQRMREFGVPLAEEAPEPADRTERVLYFAATDAECEALQAYLARAGIVDARIRRNR